MSTNGWHQSHGQKRYCGALKHQPEYEGETCKMPAGWGTDHAGVGVCKLHGGAMKNHKRHAQVVIAKQEVQLWGGRRDVHPAQALLELVHWKAAEVDYWRSKVAELEHDELTWGKTKTKTGGDDHGTTEEAKPHIALVLLRQAEQDLAAYAAAALKAGVDAALVQVARSQADSLARVIRLLLADPRVTVTGDAHLVVMDALKAIAA